MSKNFDRTGRTGSAAFFAQEPLRVIPPTVFDVRIVPQRRRWKWQVCNQFGSVLLHGWETSRPAARYRGYSALLLLLRAGCLSAALRAETNEAAAAHNDGKEIDDKEKGRPVARTAFPVSRRRHI